MSESELVNSASDSTETHDLPTKTNNDVNRGTKIGKNIEGKGDLSAREDIEINGQFEGTIALKMNKIIIGADGKIQANIFAKIIEVSGEVIGDLYASEQVIVTKTGRVIGNIFTTDDVVIEDGAHVSGSIDMGQQDVFTQNSSFDMDEEKSSGFGFLFKKGRDVSHEDSMLLPDLRENRAIAEELTSLPEDMHPGSIAPSIIGETVVMTGELISDQEDLILQGHFKGVIYFKNCSLGIGAHAEVTGDILVESLVHHGSSSGDIYASRQVSIKKPAHVTGKIMAPRVSTKGGVLMGSIQMGQVNIEEMYAKLHGPAMVIEEIVEENQADVQPQIAEENMSDATQARNTAWPIFYPRT